MIWEAGGMTWAAGLAECSRFVSEIADRAVRYEGFGGEIVVLFEFWLSTRKRLSEVVVSWQG